MAVVLGPNAINEEKFTTWSTSTKALGLIWNTASGTVSVPTEKLSKSLHQIALALNSTNCTLSTINKLIGRLRYVSTCFPAARPFYQNLQVFAGTFTRQHIRRTIPQDVREDLLWFQAVLELQHRFNSIPVEYFGDLLPPSRHVLMDASDSGLCVLETQLKQYIRMKFDATVRKSFAISNKCARINERSSGRTTLGPSMDGYRERPDSCSSSAWTQVTVHPPYNDLLNFWETISETMLSPTQRLENITLSGYNGVNSANGSAGLAGSPSPDDQQTRNSAASRHTDGSIKCLSSPVRKLQPITPAFLRLLRSEYLRIGRTRHFYCLKMNNVFFSDAEGRSSSPYSSTSVTIDLEGTMNDQVGRGAWRTMRASGDLIICPVKALKAIYKARKATATTSPYLCADLSAVLVAKALKETAKAIGVPEDRYSTHSVRIGGATDLLSGQASSIAIKPLGRWLSNCYEQYPTQAASFTKTLSRRMTENHGQQSPSNPTREHNYSGAAHHALTRGRSTVKWNTLAP
ncbi:hypothetical protein L914_06107 [Phytophthora nicotianae]|uniref:Tyr recombinase domain-containing protein n=1 Tax=Phytophthora nicotianae TaxID=4792 RepID=W2NMA6_PHYNI|nr:hypothetical protein L914_06107 [Phytophthora nicotianae]